MEAGVMTLIIFHTPRKYLYKGMLRALVFLVPVFIFNPVFIKSNVSVHIFKINTMVCSSRRCPIRAECEHTLSANL